MIKINKKVFKRHAKEPKDLTIPGGLIDLTELDYLEIVISHDGKTVWINNEARCLFRAQKINKVVIKDDRK